MAAAVEQAEAALATLGRSAPLRPGAATIALANGWRQQVAIRPLPLPSGGPSRGPTALVPYDVRLVIRDQAGLELASLATVRLGPAR
jgi:hypothetical protein